MDIATTVPLSYMAGDSPVGTAKTFATSTMRDSTVACCLDILPTQRCEVDVLLRTSMTIPYSRATSALIIDIS